MAFLALFFLSIVKHSLGLDQSFGDIWLYLLLMHLLSSLHFLKAAQDNPL